MNHMPIDISIPQLIFYIVCELRNKTNISQLSVLQSKLLPLGAVDDPMHCCPRPKATVYRVIDSAEGVIV